MHSHIQKWGNSLGIRIPIKLAKQLDLHQGSLVNLEIENGRIVIQIPEYDLDAMIKAITSKNRHHPLLDDTQVGGEEW